MSVTRVPREPRDTPRRLTHSGVDGAPQMVDVGAKGDTHRFARATGCIHMSGVTLDAINNRSVEKGDVITVARVAGILAAKRTPELVPLCHSISLTNVEVAVTPDPSLPGLRAEAIVETVGKTGVEMEAIMAVAVTLVTVFDMVKGLDKGLVISDVRLEEKRGGRSGHWHRR